MDITLSVNAFEEWLNNETEAMDDDTYIEFLEEISDRVTTALNAKREELDAKL